MKPLDKDRKMGLVLIVLLIIAWTVGYNATNEWLRNSCVIAGVGFFLWVLGLMGKSVDEHGWGDSPDDDDKKK